MSKENKKEPVWKKYVKQYAGKEKVKLEEKKSGFNHKDLPPVVCDDPYDGTMATRIKLPNGFEIAFRFSNGRLIDTSVYHDYAGRLNRPVEEAFPELKDVWESVVMKANNCYIDHVLKTFENITDFEKLYTSE